MYNHCLLQLCGFVQDPLDGPDGHAKPSSAMPMKQVFKVSLRTILTGYDTRMTWLHCDSGENTMSFYSRIWFAQGRYMLLLTQCWKRTTECRRLGFSIAEFAFPNGLIGGHTASLPSAGILNACLTNPGHSSINRFSTLPCPCRQG